MFSSRACVPGLQALGACSGICSHFRMGPGLGRSNSRYRQIAPGLCARELVTPIALMTNGRVAVSVEFAGFDADGRVNQWSQAAERLTGFTKHDECGS